MKKSVLFLTVFAFIFTSKGYAKTLSLNEYLQIAMQNNPSLQSVNAGIMSLNGQIASLERAYSITLNASGNYAYDESRRNVDTSLDSITYDASLSKMFGFGTQVSLGFSNSFTSFGNELIDNKQDLAPYIKLQQSLLQDFNGALTKAKMEKARADLRKSLYQLEQNRRNIILNAKLAYWNYSYSKTILEYRTASLGRSQRILDWVQNRFRLDLAERVDFLQSQAAVKSRQLALQQAREDEINKKRSFYQFLNANEASDYDVESFENIGVNYEKDKSLIKRGTRLDVLAASESVKSAQYDRDSFKLSLGADLSLTGQVSLNGIDKTFSDAFSQVSGADRPSFAVGLQYSLPLDFSLRNRVNKGYEAALLSQRAALEAAIIQERDDWQKYLDQWEGATLRLALAQELKTLQQQRYE
ncbi:MAG: TolC family protein, partial [Elusimicrobiota bacterium]|nr:TolC family protein [Elusimicrobiota bacterium]